MSDFKSWYVEFKDWAKKIIHYLAEFTIIPYWAWRMGSKPRPGGPRDKIQSADNIQHMMNLIMPLKDKSTVGRLEAMLAIQTNQTAIYSGLNNVGTVHFARFLMLDGNLCMISVYDGDFTNYIRDFIATIGNLFDAIVVHVEGGRQVIPCEENVEAFIEFVHAHDLFQSGDIANNILHVDDPSTDGNFDLRSAMRSIILQTYENPNLSIGGYRDYPGYSVSQIRQLTEMGW